MKQSKFKETKIGLSAPKTKLRQAGKIPEDWEVKAIGDVASFENGYAFFSRDYVKCSPVFGIGLDELAGRRK